MNIFLFIKNILIFNCIVFHLIDIKKNKNKNTARFQTKGIYLILRKAITDKISVYVGGSEENI